MGSVVTCPKCGDTGTYCASCVAYRHLLKDVARTKGEREMNLAAIRALDDDRLQFLGKVMHRIVKAAVHVDDVFMAHGTEEDLRKYLLLLHEQVKDLPWSTAVIQGWLSKE